MKYASLAAAFLLPLIVLGTAGCDSGTEPVGTEPVGTEQASEEQEIAVQERQQTPEPSEQYPIHGEVVAVDREKPSVTLDHEEIEGFMKAMKMEFQVESAAVLEGLEEGDQVQGRLVKKDGKFVITEIKENTE